MSSGIDVRVLRTEAELEELRDVWSKWCQHPNADLDFYLAIVKSRRAEVIGPYVLALYRHGVLETILVGRLERDRLTLGVGYLNVFALPVQSLAFIYGGLLGNSSDENCAALSTAVNEQMRRERVHLTSLHFVNVESPMRRALARATALPCRDLFADSRPHWIMRLPTDAAALYEDMSPKARRNRRYEANRLQNEGGRIVRYEAEADIERVLVDAESIACRTYQRGLGVGFVSNEENRQRFLVDARRGRFRGYFLYLGDKPVAFFLGTLHKNVLYDNFTAYDPAHAKYSPGTFLFYKIFEELCSEGVRAVDFGFGDAWYKAQFGNQRNDETTVTAFASSLRGVSLNLIRLPFIALDRLGKIAVERLAPLRTVKKRWRNWAQRRATA